MAVTGYQCQQCWATYVDEHSCGDADGKMPPCPYCQSTSVKKVDLPESWVGRARSGLRFG